MPTPTITQAMPMAILAVESSTSSISNGASRIAAIAPAIAVTRVNIAVIRPCRNPEIAAAIDQQHDDDVDDAHGRVHGPAPIGRARGSARSPQVRQFEVALGSHGTAQPPSASSASTSPAVKPQTSRSATWKAGPTKPLGWRT